MRCLRSFWRDERGAAAIEYAVIGSVISIAIVVGARSIGTTLQTMFFQKVAGNLT